MPPVSAPIPPPPRGGSRSSWYVGGIAAVLLIAVGAVVAVAASGGKSHPAATAVTSPPTVPASNSGDGQVSVGTTAPLAAASTAPSNPVPNNPVPNNPVPRSQTYRSATYGFSVVLPGSYRQTSAMLFQSPDGELSVTMFEAPRQSGVGPAAGFEAARRSYEAAGATVTYPFHDSREYVVSGLTASDDVYYQFRYYGRHGVGGFTFVYPESYPGLAKASAAAIDRAYHSFRPGGL